MVQADIAPQRVAIAAYLHSDVSRDAAWPTAHRAARYGLDTVTVISPTQREHGISGIRHTRVRHFHDRIHDSISPTIRGRHTVAAAVA
jgi:hypothetical protein